MKKFLSYFVYWLIQCTWGIIMTVIGAIAAIIIGLFITDPVWFGPNLLFVFGKDWGGISLGPFIFVSTMNYAYDNREYHEAGHSLQNITFGPIFPFIIGIPSLIRCSYHNYMIAHAKTENLPDYDAIWFEGQATRWGTKTYKKKED